MIPDQGSGPDYCSANPKDPHHMVSLSAGKAVRFVEICSLCDWIDGEALDGWAENFLKEQLSARAQRIAVAIETEPFAFVQRSDEDLTLEEVIGQALGAASTCWVGGTGDREFDSARAKEVMTALLGEVRRFQRLALEDAATRAVELAKANHAHTSSGSYFAAIRKAVEGGQSDGTDRVKAWSDLAYELYALACNSKEDDHCTPIAWQKSFERLKARFHELLP